MIKIQLTHEIQCNVDRFWKLFFDDAFNQKMYLDGLQFKEFEILRTSDNERTLFRTLRAIPKLDMPGAVAKILGSSFRYTEEGSFDKNTKIWRWRATPSVLADKMRNEGVIHVEPEGETLCRREVEITLDVHVLMIGRMLEATFEKALRDGWNRSADWMNAYIRSNG